MAGGIGGLIKRLYDGLIGYALKFGVVGVVGLVVDVTVFNLFRTGTFGDDHFFSGPVGAKIVAVTMATVVTWFGNRYWTFRANRRRNFVLELAEFAAVSLGGMLINVSVVWFSHYVLGFQSLLADNISANVIGFGLATAFRFLLYRFWVFSHHRTGTVAAHREAEVAAAAIFESDEAAAHDKG